MIAGTLKLIRNKEGVVGFNCEKCSAWNPSAPGRRRFVLESDRVALPCASCGATHEFAVVKSAVGFKLKPYLCENCGKTTPSVRPRFKGATAILTCEHCGTETTQSVSDLKKNAVAFNLQDYLCQSCGKTTSVGPPRFEGSTAVFICEHCGAETSRSASDLN
jgi:transcription elongation factor Elf1